MQSNLDQRVFLFTASPVPAWTDLTPKVNEWTSGQSATVAMVPGDYLYIGCFLPFNHKYFKLSTVSGIARTPLIEVLNAPNEWSPVVDQIDYTVGFTGSGVLQWTPNFDKNWALVTDSRRDISSFLSTTGPTVYGAYWLRISFSAAISMGIDYIGQRFSTDDELYQEYPNLKASAVLNGWKAGKTDWQDQHLTAACYIGKELVQRNILITNQQILDIATLRSASVHKTAHIIFSGLGVKNYVEEIKSSLQAYTEAMNLDRFQVDTNANARKDRNEVSMNTTSRATR